MMTLQHRYEVSTEIHEISARRAVTELGRGLGFKEKSLDKRSLLVTECANYLLETKGGGELIARPLVIGNTPGASHRGVEVLSIIRGPEGLHGRSPQLHQLS